MNAYETLAKNVLRKRQSFTLEQRSQITLPNSVTSERSPDGANRLGKNFVFRLFPWRR
jgi:hypothetical protein